MAPEGLQGSESHAFQERLLHGSLSPSASYSTSPQPPMDPTPHRPSSLRYATTPGTPAATPTSRSTFSVVMGSQPKKSLNSNTIGGPSTEGKKRGRSLNNSRGTPPTQSIPKKKGRLFKNAGVAAATTPAAASDHILKNRGRPFRYTQGPERIKRVVPPEPKFVLFMCEWKNCPAELHNLDTLRAHLHTVHLKKQPPGGPYVCKWRKCCREREVMEVETGASKLVEQGVDFKTKEEWRNHIKVAHLDPVAWHQGDGPKVALDFGGGSQPDTSLSYLCDEEGRQVTPSIKNQPIEDGRAKVLNAARFQKQREGLYVICVPVRDPHAYMKIKYDEHDNDAGDQDDMDEL